MAGPPVIDAVVPDTWVVGIGKMRTYIDSDTNPAMARNHMFTKMPQGQMDIPKWGVELEK